MVCALVHSAGARLQVHVRAGRGGDGEVSANVWVLPCAPPARPPTHGEATSPRAAACPAGHADVCHIRHQWAPCPLSPGRGDASPLMKPQAAPGATTLRHPLVQRGLSGEPRARQPAAQAAPPRLPSPPGWQGTRATSPVAAPQAPVQDLRQLCPLPVPGVPLIRAGDPAGWQPRGHPPAPFSVLCPQCQSRGQGGTLHSCRPRPWQGKTRPSGKWMGLVPSTSPCSGTGSPCAEPRGSSSVRGRVTFQGREMPPRPNLCPLSGLQGETGKLLKAQDLAAGLSGSLPGFSLTLKVAFEAAQPLPK